MEALDDVCELRTAHCKACGIEFSPEPKEKHWKLLVVIFATFANANVFENRFQKWNRSNQ